MPEKPNDRPKKNKAGSRGDDPKIYLIVDGRKFPRPGLETLFAEYSPEADETTEVKIETYCVCNKVCTCDSVCTCDTVGSKEETVVERKVRYSAREQERVAAANRRVRRSKCYCVEFCLCDSHSSCYGGGGGCRCAPVH